MVGATPRNPRGSARAQTRKPLYVPLARNTRVTSPSVHKQPVPRRHIQWTERRGNPRRGAIKAEACRRKTDCTW